MAAECEVYATHELAVHSRSRTRDHVLVLVFSLRPVQMPQPFTRAITTKTTTTPIHISGCSGRFGICFGSSIGVVRSQYRA